MMRTSSPRSALRSWAELASAMVASCPRGAGFHTPDGGTVPRAAGSSPATTVQAKGKKAGVAPAVPFSTYHQSRSRAPRDGATAACPEGSHQRTLPCHSCRRATATCMALRSLWRLWPCWSCLTGFLLPHSRTQLGLSAHSRPPGLLAEPEQFARRPIRTWHLRTLPVTCLRQRHETVKIPLALLVQSLPLSIHTPFSHTRPHNSAIRDS